MLDFSFKGPKPSARVVYFFFFLKKTFILTEGTSVKKKAKREIYCLEVTKKSGMNIWAAFLTLHSGFAWRKCLSGSPSQFCSEFAPTRLLNHAWAVPNRVLILFEV